MTYDQIVATLMEHEPRYDFDLDLVICGVTCGWRPRSADTLRDAYAQWVGHVAGYLMQVAVEVPSCG